MSTNAPQTSGGVKFQSIKHEEIHHVLSVDSKEFSTANNFVVYPDMSTGLQWLDWREVQESEPRYRAISQFIEHSLPNRTPRIDALADRSTRESMK
jgi:hypothetical protein